LSGFARLRLRRTSSTPRRFGLAFRASGPTAPGRGLQPRSFAEVVLDRRDSHSLTFSLSHFFAPSLIYHLRSALCVPNPAIEPERSPQMPMNTSFSVNALSPDKGLGAFEPKTKKASKGGGPFLGGGGFPSRPTLGLAKPTLEGKHRGMAQGFGLAAHPPLLQRGPLREWLCLSARAAKLGAGRRRGREWPSPLINNFFSFGVAQPSPKAPPLPSRNLGVSLW
jgi:hypothetical protein